MFILLDNSNPAILFPGTTWQKQEGRFLQGTSGSETPGTTGGVSSVALTTSHMPPHDHTGSVNIIQNGDHRHQVDNHLHTQPSHTHSYKAPWTEPSGGYFNPSGGAYPVNNRTTGSAGGENTGGSAPYTNTTGGHGHSATLSINKNGSGSSFSIIPPYLKVNIWKRLT